MKQKDKGREADTFEVCISKEELNRLPIEKYSGEIVTVSTVEELEEAISELEKAALIGFDTETKPAFKKGQVHNMALIQMATDKKCFLIRICKFGIPEKLKTLLADKNIPKVGLSLRDDFHGLAKLSDVTPGGFIDIQEMVKDFLITDSSLTKIHAILFGRRISKSQQLSNWEANSLTDKQKEYASLDALACINIYRHLREGQFVPQKSKYYQKKQIDDAQKTS